MVANSLNVISNHDVLLLYTCSNINLFFYNYTFIFIIIIVCKCDMVSMLFDGVYLFLIIIRLFF